MSIVALMLILVSLLAILTIPSYRMKQITKDKSILYPALYAELYDGIYFNTDKFEKEMQYLSAPEESYILDVGCGTGDRVGYTAHAVGVDISPAMVAVAQKKYPSKTFIVGDVSQQNTFEKDTFTEVWCLGNSIYYLPEKLHFMQNVFRWLDADGTFVLQLSGSYCSPSPYNKDFAYDLRKIGNTCRERVRYKGKKAVVDTTFYPEKPAKLITMAERVGFKLEKQQDDLYFFRKLSF
jgi:SAM-dependent methyltransferase